MIVPVLARHVSPGLRFDRSLEFYRIADLSRVWIVADLFEGDAAAMHAGTTAKVTWRGRTLRARMTLSVPETRA